MKLAGPAATRAASKDKPPRFVLLTGPDSGMLRKLGEAVTKQYLAANAGLEVRRFNDEDLRADPNCVAQAVESASLFGGAAIAIVRASGEKDAGPILAMLDQTEKSGSDPEGAVILDMGDVARGSKTRKRFEDSSHAWSLQLYEPTRDDLAIAAQAQAKALGAAIQPDALGLILDEIAQDSDAVAAEVLKLAQYAGVGGTIDTDAVKALGSASREAGLDEAVEAAFSGDPALTVTRLEQAFGSGANGVLALNQIGRRVRLLLQLRAGIESGGNAADLVKVPRLGIFWKKQADVARQANLWTRSALDDVLTAVIEADAAVKRARAPTEALVEQLLTRIARRAKAVRR